MKTAALTFLILLVRHLRLSESASVLSPTVDVMETASYLQYLEEDVNFQSCSVTLGNEAFTLDLHAVKDAVAKSTDSHNLASRMMSLGLGLCGYTFYNASMNDPCGGWLMVTDEDDKGYRSSFIINVYDMDAQLEVTQDVVLGTSTTISCGSNRVRTSATFTIRPADWFSAAPDAHM